jgi:hypothetical protein
MARYQGYHCALSFATTRAVFCASPIIPKLKSLLFMRKVSSISSFTQHVENLTNAALVAVELGA